MLGSKFITLLKTLDKRELKLFSQYLSRLHPGKKIQHQVFGFIKQFAPNYDSPRLNHNEALQLVFKESARSPKKLTDCLSDLNLLLTEYLLWEESKKSNFENSIATIRILKKRKLDEATVKLIKKTQRRLQSEKVKDEWYYLKQLQLNHELFFINKPVVFSEETENLNKYIEHLELFFTVSKLKLIAEVNNRKSILGINDKVETSACIDQHLKNNAGSDILLLKIYTDIIKLVNQQDHSLFNKVKSSILANQDQLSKRDLKTLLTYLINYSAVQIRKGDLSFFNEVLELSKVGIKHQALFENDHIPSSRFVNLIDVACTLGEFEWADQFISQHSIYLEKPLRNNTIQISKARICFAKNEFSNVIRILSTLNSKNIYFELRARGLLLRSYVELKEDKEFILNFCNAFEQYLRRKNELGTSILTGYHNLVKITRHIISKRKSKKELLTIKENMEELLCKQWVEEQIATI